MDRLARLARYGLLFLGLAASSTAAYDYEAVFDAQDRATWPVIAIILDDIGNNLGAGLRSAELPGPVALAILPHTPHGRSVAGIARDTGKEVLLHLPLEALDSNGYLGPGALTLDLTQEEFAAQLEDNLAWLGPIDGVNNHMGSLLTRHPGHMKWLMRALQSDSDRFFVDSRTTERSVALTVAVEHGIPATRRDVFLDSETGAEHVAVQFERLKAHARRYGFAVGIGHPHPRTLKLLEAEIPRLEARGYRLTTVRNVIKLQQQTGFNASERTWRVSSSH